MAKRDRRERLKGRRAQKTKNKREIPGRSAQRNCRAFKMKGTKEIPNNRTGGELLKRKTKNRAQHGVETRDGRVRNRALVTKKKKEIRNLGNGRAGD